MTRTLSYLAAVFAAVAIGFALAPASPKAAPVGGGGGPLNAARNAAAVDPSCNGTISMPSVDPVVGTTVTTISRLAGSRSWDIQNKSTTDCYAVDGPQVLTTTGTTGWYIPGADYRAWSFGHGPNLGPLQIACKAVGTTVHVEQCR